MIHASSRHHPGVKGRPSNDSRLCRPLTSLVPQFRARIACFPAMLTVVGPSSMHIAGTDSIQSPPPSLPLYTARFHSLSCSHHALIKVLFDFRFCRSLVGQFGLSHSYFGPGKQYEYTTFYSFFERTQHNGTPNSTCTSS